MKLRVSFFVLLFSFLFASQNAWAAARASAVPDGNETIAAVKKPDTNLTSKKAAKWEAKKERWKKKFEKKMAKWTKKAKKKEKKRGPVAMSNYLTLCLILFLAALVFFAIGGAVFSIFGSVSALASAVFFVLWLMEYTGNL